MKYPIFLSGLFLVLFSCVQHNQDAEILQRQNDSLVKAATTRDSVINDYFLTLNKIEGSLQTIKTQEGIIDLEQEGDLAESQKEKINQDLLTIIQSLEKNRQKIAKLQKKMKKSGVKIDQLNKMVARLGKELALKAAEIESLKTELDKKNILIDSLFAGLDSLKLASVAKDSVIATTQARMNEAFYLVGTKKDLIEAGVITKKMKISDKIDKSKFVKANIQETEHILIGAKSAEILSVHDKDSYRIDGSKSNTEKISILDKEEFWSVSRYLVVVVE